MTKTNVLKRFWGDMFFCDSEGSGIPLLFLHGTGCDSTDWDIVISELPKEQRYLTLDFRGHGRSTAPLEPFTIDCLADDVLNLIYALDVQEVVLVGHSLGGMVAMEAARRDARVTALVLLEGWTCLSVTRTAFDTGRFYGSLPNEKIREIQQKAGMTRDRFGERVWDSFWQSVRDFDGWSFLENAKIPIYEVFGEMGRHETTEKLLRIPTNPSIGITWIPDSGHYLPHERPVEVAEICQYSISSF